MPSARDVIRAIVAIEPAVTEPYKRISSEQGDEIGRLFEGDFTLFQELDEQPGRFMSSYYHGGPDDVYSYDQWHWKLRQARNDRNSAFFDVMRDDFLLSEHSGVQL